jgi:hypothetical protein
MSDLLIERPPLTPEMQESLKKYILSERRKKKEQDFANEQKIKEQLVKYIHY